MKHIREKENQEERRIANLHNEILFYVQKEGLSFDEVEKAVMLLKETYRLSAVIRPL